MFLLWVRLHHPKYQVHLKFVSPQHLSSQQWRKVQGKKTVKVPLHHITLISFSVGAEYQSVFLDISLGQKSASTSHSPINNMTTNGLPSVAVNSRSAFDTSVNLFTQETGNLQRNVPPSNTRLSRFGSVVRRSIRLHWRTSINCCMCWLVSSYVCLNFVK